MNTALIPEERYEELMDHEVMPYLEHCRKSGCFMGVPVKEEVEPRIYYDYYELDAPRGNIVISHGFTENGVKYDELIYYFLKEGYQVFVQDHRGHGRSFRAVEGYSMTHVDSFDSYIKDLTILITMVAQENAKGAPIYLFAHSMGGGIGAGLLEQYPDLVKKAVLSSPMIGVALGMSDFVASLVAGMGNLFAAKKYVPGHHDYDGKETFESSAGTGKARFEYYEAQKRKTPWMQNSGATFGWLNACLKGTKELIKPENCSRISVPVLLCQAGKDTFVSCEAQDLFQSRCREGLVQLIRFPEEKHELYRSKNTSLSSYLEQVFAFLEA